MSNSRRSRNYENCYPAPPDPGSTVYFAASREQSSASQKSSFRNAADRSVASRQLPWRTQELGRAAVPVRVLFLRRRLARVDHRLRRHQAAPEIHPRDAHRLARGGAEPRRRDAVHAVAGARTRRTAPAAVDDHAARLARARAELQGPAGRAQGKGSRDLRLPRLPAAAERGHPAVSPGLTCRWAKTRSRMSRSRAKSRAASITSMAASPTSKPRPRTPSSSSAAATARCTSSCARNSRRRATSSRSKRRARWSRATTGSPSPIASGC